MNDLDTKPILEQRGTSENFVAHVTGIAFNRAGTHAAFALGDGTLRVTKSHHAEWHTVAAHDGNILALTHDATRAGFLSGGDDGRFVRSNAAGEISELGTYGSKWVEQVNSFTDGKTGLLACAVGKFLHLFDAAGTPLKTLEHPSTVTGIAFDAKGKRVAASHYNGASLWFTGSTSAAPRRFDWKGSHTGIALHPGGEAIVTAMQENALHGWRLPGGEDMRMSGYPARTDSLSFTKNGKFLATSGADAVVLWPFFGGGPMGKAPLELGQIPDILCTRVACHPTLDMVAAGYTDGTVALIDIATKRVLPIAPAGGSPISALTWSLDGAYLAFGTEQGFAALVDLAPRA